MHKSQTKHRTQTSQSTKGVLISFDGIDSSGKETQAKALVSRLEKDGQEVESWQTPDYNLESGKVLKALFQGKNGGWDGLPWQEQMKLIADNRAEHRNEVIAHLKGGGIVVYDRYVPSSVAHMTVSALANSEVETGRTKIQEQVADYEYGINEMPQEELSIFLDLPPQAAADLLARRKDELAEETEQTDDLNLQQRIYDEYQWLISHQPGHFIRIACLDKDRLRPIEDIADDLWQQIANRFPSILRNIGT